MPGKWIEKIEPECHCLDLPSTLSNDFGAGSKWQCDCGALWQFDGDDWLKNHSMEFSWIGSIGVPSQFRRNLRGAR